MINICIQISITELIEVGRIIYEKYMVNGKYQFGVLDVTS
jgi:hypothetical protein